MAATIAPNIATDGLIALWDAGNRRSYPGTGTVWTDTVGGHNGVLTNGPTFSEDNFGSIVFDGSDDSVVIPDSDAFDFGTGPFSISLWFKSYGAAYNMYQTLFGHHNGNHLGTALYIVTAQPILGWEEFRQLLWYVAATGKKGTTGINDNVWHNVTVTRASDGAYAMYIDAVVQNSGTGLTGTATTANDVIFGRDYGYALMGSINYEMVYNRALTPEEVLQNYKAIKPRFIPRVTLEGLVANLDAGNPHSYAGVGTTWNSLAVDFSRDGTLINSPSFSSENGGFFSFDGTDEYVLLPTPDNSTQPLTGWGSMTGLDTNNYSLEMWFRTNDAANPTGYCYNTSALMGRDNGADVVANWNIWQGELIFTHYNGAAWICTPTSTTDVSDDAWYHAVFVNHSNETGDIYINGVAEATGVSTSIGSGGGYTYYFHPDYIARGYNGQYFDGDVAVCRVYDKALSANEVLQNYRAMESRFDSNIIQEGLKANWDAHNRLSYPGTGTTWTSLVKEFKGTLTNGPAFSSDNGGIIDFDGTNDYVSVPDSSLLRFGEGQFTISMWVFDENDDLSYYAWMTKGQTGADEWSLYHSGSNRLRFYADDGGIDMSYTGVMASAWHHIVATRDSTQANLYRDGVSVATDTSEDYDLNTTKDISIGASEEGSARFTTGKIANVQLYDRALTADEVLQNYNTLKNRFT